MAASSLSARRIVVVGTTGSGKSTLANQLANRFELPHIEMDALFWGPDWTSVPVEVFRSRVTAALQCDEWVADGNYSMARDIVWPRATMLVWLDYPLSLILPRLVQRTLRRVMTHEVLWHNNTEKLRSVFFSRDSLLLWALQSHPRMKRQYPLEMAKPEHAHLVVVQLHTPHETEDWLNAFAPERGAVVNSLQDNLITRVNP